MDHLVYLFIGKKVSVVEPIEGSSSAQNDESINDLVNPSNVVSIQPNEYLCQPSVETNVSDSAAQITENQPPTALYLEPLKSSAVSHSNDVLELRTIWSVDRGKDAHERTPTSKIYTTDTYACQVKRQEAASNAITDNISTTDVQCQQVTGPESSNSLQHLTETPSLRTDGDLDLEESVLMLENSQE